MLAAMLNVTARTVDRREMDVGKGRIMRDFHCIQARNTTHENDQRAAFGKDRCFCIPISSVISTLPLRSFTNGETHKAQKYGKHLIQMVKYSFTMVIFYFTNHTLFRVC